MKTVGLAAVVTTVAFTVVVPAAHAGPLLKVAETLPVGTVADPISIVVASCPAKPSPELCGVAPVPDATVGCVSAHSGGPGYTDARDVCGITSPAVTLNCGTTQAERVLGYGIRTQRTGCDGHVGAVVVAAGCTSESSSIPGNFSESIACGTWPISYAESSQGRTDGIGETATLTVGSLANDCADGTCRLSSS